MPRTVANTCNLTGENPLNVARLLRGVGKGLNAKYNSTIFGTGISVTGCQTWNLPGNIDNFFSDLGFTSYDRDFDSNRALLQGQLINSNPVIVYGASCDVCFGSMHIWIIDGIRKSAALIPLEEPNCIDEPNEMNQPNARTTGRVCCYQSEFISLPNELGLGRWPK